MRDKGYLAIVLHSHLPYLLSHGTWPHGMDWLNEAAAESYIPLLESLYRLKNKGYNNLITIGLTPVLQEQLKDERFISAFRDYLSHKKEAAREDEAFFRKTGDPRESLSRDWFSFYSGIEKSFEEKFNTNLLSAFRKLQDEGIIEIITSAATHGYLPLLGTDNSVNAQIAIGKSVYKNNLGREPDGIWLPECAYRPRYKWIPPVNGGKAFLRRGVEEYVNLHRIKYFIVDTPLLKGGKSLGVYIDRFEALKQLWHQFEASYKPRAEQPKSPYRIYYIGKGEQDFQAVTVFTRDEKSGLQVWSGEWGYPGNPAYLDFHKKSFPSGLRYWRVTDAKLDLALKKLYNPAWIESTFCEQADHFVNLCKDILRGYYKKLEFPGIITTPYDTELIGHWWFEGPRWLEKVLENMSIDKEFGTSTASYYLKKFPPFETVELPEGSWGQGNFHYIWLNEWTKWTWHHIYEMEHEMVKWANYLENNATNDNLRRILKQAARELLLMESSDWQFLISTWSARDYAEQRFWVHTESTRELFNFAKQYVEKGELGGEAWKRIEFLEQRDRLFEDIDPLLWSDKNARVLES